MPAISAIFASISVGELARRARRRLRVRRAPRRPGARAHRRRRCSARCRRTRRRCRRRAAGAPHPPVRCEPSVITTVGRSARIASELTVWPLLVTTGRSIASGNVVEMSRPTTLSPNPRPNTVAAIEPEMSIGTIRSVDSTVTSVSPSRSWETTVAGSCCVRASAARRCRRPGGAPSTRPRTRPGHRAARARPAARGGRSAPSPSRSRAARRSCSRASASTTRAARAIGRRTVRKPRRGIMGVRA